MKKWTSKKIFRPKKKSRSKRQKKNKWKSKNNKVEPDSVSFYFYCDS